MEQVYLKSLNGTMVKEIRRITKVNGETKYVIECNGKTRFANRHEFMKVPMHYELYNKDIHI